MLDEASLGAVQINNNTRGLKGFRKPYFCFLFVTTYEELLG
jgi:hypothetical protein